jgi:hypothetical protein
VHWRRIASPLGALQFQMNRLRLWDGRQSKASLSFLFGPSHSSYTASSRNQLTFSKNRVAELLVDDIVYNDIVISYEELFNDMGVRPCTDSSGIGWRSGQGGG